MTDELLSSSLWNAPGTVTTSNTVQTMTDADADVRLSAYMYFGVVMLQWKFITDTERSELFFKCVKVKLH